jgi:hypothetical protein
LAVVGSQVAWVVSPLLLLTAAISLKILVELGRLVTYQLVHTLSVRISVLRFWVSCL